MIRYIIYIILIGFVLWKGKPYLKGAILKYLDKKNKKPLEKVNNDLVYVPVTSSRVFYFALEIKEVGGGQAVVTVLKKKDLDNTFDK